VIPVVRGRHPLWEQASLEAEDPETARLLAPLDHGPGEWRGSLVVSVVDARPQAVVHMPRSSFGPFIMAVGFVFIFAGRCWTASFSRASARW
jgi:hypothetical protein